MMITTYNIEDIPGNLSKSSWVCWLEKLMERKKRKTERKKEDRKKDRKEVVSVGKV